MRHGRNCIICGQEYAYCPDCTAFAHLPRWMFNFHDENCKKIWDALNDYKAGIKNANQAKYALQQLDLSKKDHFTEDVKVLINKICSEATPSRQVAVVQKKEKHNNK